MSFRAGFQLGFASTPDTVFNPSGVGENLLDQTGADTLDDQTDAPIQDQSS